jgi:hypothetical protein
VRVLLERGMRYTAVKISECAAQGLLQNIMKRKTLSNQITCKPWAEFCVFMTLSVLTTVF